MELQGRREEPAAVTAAMERRVWRREQPVREERVNVPPWLIQENVKAKREEKKKNDEDDDDLCGGDDGDGFAFGSDY